MAEIKADRVMGVGGEGWLACLFNSNKSWHSDTFALSETAERLPHQHQGRMPGLRSEASWRIPTSTRSLMLDHKTWLGHRASREGHGFRSVLAAAFGTRPSVTLIDRARFQS
jgi:hypothetical protein